MQKRNIDFKKILVPSDAIALLVIILGLAIAIFLDELAIRLIGVSIVILGGVALFMLISQRLSEFVESKQFKPSSTTPIFKVSVQKGEDAKRQVIENYADEFGADDDGFKIVDPDTTKSNTKTQLPIKAKEVNKDLNIPEDFKLTVISMDKKEDDKAKAEKKFVDENEVIKETPESIAKEVIETKEIKGTPKVIKSKDNPDLFTPAVVEEKPKSVVEEVKPEPEAIEEVESPDYQSEDVELPASFFEDSEQFVGQEPRKEFQHFLNRVLKVIRSVTSTDTSAFFMINVDKSELVLEAYDTDNSEAMIDQRKIKFGKDVVSKIASEMKPEILTEINPTAEMELIPYYKRAVGTCSFIGVPVYYKKVVVGVLCADTSASDAYNNMTVGFFGHFSKLVSSLVHSYTEKYDMMQRTRTLDAITNFRSITANQDMEIEDIARSVVESAVNILEYSTIGLCAYEESTGGWKIVVIKSRDEDRQELAGKYVEIGNSLTGQTIYGGRTVYQAPVHKSILRFNSKESQKEVGFFVSVPLKSFKSVYGALFVEGKNRTNLTQNDITILETLGEHAGTSLEQMHTSRMLQNSAIIDVYTGMMNPPALYQRLTEEVERGSALGKNFTFAMLKIDIYSSYNPQDYPDRYDQVFYHVADIISQVKRKYDLYGRIDSSTIGIILVESDLVEAKIWAEQLRKEIASSVLEIERNKLAVTVSVGLAQLGALQSPDTLVANCKHALKQSEEKMNSVTVFS
jgi:diguanylate cyclase (GGDEF)-like protein